MAAQLKYDKEWYTPSQIVARLKASPEARKEARKEYTRLRDISQKRLKRMGKTQWARTQTYKKNVNHYKKLKDIKSDYELAGRLSDLARFIVSKYSSVAKQKEIMKKSLATLHEHGYGFVNEDNYIDFGDFMEAYRNQMLDMEYDSGDAADTYGVVSKFKLDPADVEKDFRFWLENVEAAKKLRFSDKSESNYDRVKARAMVKAGVAKNVDAALRQIKKEKAKEASGK